VKNYPTRYVIMLALGALAVITGGISGFQHFTATAPSWLTPDVGATCAIIAGICGGLVALVQQTPTAVAKSHVITKKTGNLPHWVSDKYLAKIGDRA
jgi:hypothetical protein